jgi:hypothetical protein
MSDKKQKEAMVKKVKQVLVVGACVLFVVLMILSGMGSNWLKMFTVVKPGDAVVVDYTFYDISGKPLLTTNQQIYSQLTTKGQSIIFGKQLPVTAGQNLTKSLYPVQIYTEGNGWTGSFAIFGTEYDAISETLIGMKTGDQKRIRLTNASLSQTWSKETLERNNVSIDLMNVGDSLAMGVSDKPEEMASNASVSYTRIGEITSKTADGIVIDFGYPYVDITVTTINPNSD